jgi:hypothetical protein
VRPDGSYKNRRFGKSIASIIRLKEISALGTTLAVVFLRRVSQLVVFASVVLSSLIRIFETSVLSTDTLLHVPEGDIFIVIPVKKPKSYISPLI